MAVAATLAQRALFTSAAANPTTITSASIGTASADRIVEVTIDCNTGTFTAITSMTIGGVTATKGVEVINGAGSVSKWWALVPTGTTGDIVINFTTPAATSLDYTTYAITGCDTTTPVPATNSTGTQTWSASAAAKTVTVDVPANGAAICSLTGFISRGSLNWTTSGATEQDDVTNVGSSAVYTTSSTQAGHGIQSTPSGTATIGGMAVVVYQPPPITVVLNFLDWLVRPKPAMVSY